MKLTAEFEFELKPTSTKDFRKTQNNFDFAIFRNKSRRRVKTKKKKIVKVIKNNAFDM